MNIRGSRISGKRCSLVSNHCTTRLVICRTSGGNFQPFPNQRKQILEDADKLVQAAWGLLSDRLLDTRIRLLSEQRLAEERKKDSATAAIASLRAQKLAILRERWLDSEGNLRLDRGLPGDLRDLKDILATELALCDTRGDRITRLQRHVKATTELARWLESEYRASRSSRFDVGQARLQVVDAEILLQQQLGSQE